MRKLIAVTLLSGCGSTLFALTPRSEPIVSDVARLQPTWGGGPVVGHELHRQTMKPMAPAIVGTIIDTVLTTTLIVNAANDANSDGGAVLGFGAIGAAILAMDVFVISSRTVTDERVEPTWLGPPQGEMLIPNQAATSGYSTTSPSFSINVSGTCPATPSCTPPATLTPMPPPGPMPNAPVEVVVPTD
jgi:hypothetical protein